MGKKCLSVSPCKRVIVLNRFACHFQVAFEPLYGFQIVLVLGLGQLDDIEPPLGSDLLQPHLEQLQITHEFVLELGFPVKLAHRHCLLVV
jgi:hypothetical protein